MKLSKRVIAIIVTLLICFTVPFSMAGCKDKGSNEKLSIAFVEAGYGRAWLVKWIEEYNKAHPNEEITVSLDGSPNMTAEIGTRLDTSTGVADIFVGLQTNWQDWAARGLLENLDDLYESEVDEGVKLKDFIIDDAAKFGIVNGKYYAVPLNDGVTGLVYNKTMFEAKGWQVPKTVEELYALCSVISADPDGIAPFVWAGQAMYWDYPVMAWWAQYQGVDEFHNFYKFDSPQVYKQEGREKALEVFSNLISNGRGGAKNSVEGCMSKNHIEAQMAFIQGKAAMIPNGMWLEYEMRNNIEPGTIEFNMMPTPAINGAKTDENGEVIKVNNTMMGDFMIIPKEAKNKELAKKFIQFVSSAEMSKLYTQACGSVRPFKYSVADVSGLSSFTRSCLDIWESSRGLYEVSQSPMYYKNYTNLWPETGKPYGLMIADNATAESIVKSNYDFVVSKWSAWQAELGLN